MKRVRNIELLAPARDYSVGIAAIDHGADAVYIGASHFGARAAAGNDISDIARLADYAHKFKAKVYATVNTVLYDNELRSVEAMVKQLYKSGVDALIVQDMAMLRLDLPPIALHSSTQCDLRTPEKAAFLEAVGFSQLVLARELTIDEIRAIREVTSVPLEGFCHGALCVSYSGRCQVSQMLYGRSANRGECAQVCRMAWNLTDEAGNVIMKDKHLLSLRDFNAGSHIGEMIDAGVSSFKIEGRLKDANYVKNIVAYYRGLLDKEIALRDDLVRASCGTVINNFTPSPDKSFNRSFTDYFLHARKPVNSRSMASIDTPKSLGEPIGTMMNCRGNELVVKCQVKINNGDGLSYFDTKGVFSGFRVNMVAGNKIYAREKVNVPKGATLYRTFNKAFTDVLSHKTAERKIMVDSRLWLAGERLCLRLEDERGNMIVKAVKIGTVEKARTNQGERQRAALSKLGGSIYQLRQCVTLDDLFIPVSVLSELRRDSIAELDRANEMRLNRERRKREDVNVAFPRRTLVSADNVANLLAEQFYRNHGVTDIEPALEVAATVDRRAVMHTRYCLRRELGACLKDASARGRLPAKIYLSQHGLKLEVKCHCERCEMTLHVVKS